MGNKQQLQLNNETLGSILSKVLGLPNQESLKHGAYVWKKCTSSSTITIEFTVVSIYPLTLKASCNDIDLTTVSSDFFVGLSGTYTRTSSGYEGPYVYEFTSSKSIILNTSENSFTYEPSKRTIIVDKFFDDYMGVWSSAEKDVPPTFLDFTVSDDPTAYPDGGEQGGYWYEKVVEGITPEMFGCTKYAVDTFTFSSRTELVDPINHSLNEIPKIAFIIAKTTSGMADSDIISMFGMKKIQKDQVTATGLIYYSSTLENAWDSSRGFNYFYGSKVSFNGYSRYFAAGVEYTLITMA